MLASAQIAAQPAFPLAAGVPVNAEKPNQGLASKNRALHQGQTACNSTTALGLSWCWQAGTASGAGVTYDYDAWGNTLNVTGSTPNVYRYRGEEYDPDLNLYYLRARYFNPLTGRFLTRDLADGKIFDPRSLHRYLYAAGDPVDAIDPTGRANLFENLLLMARMALPWAAYNLNGFAPGSPGLAGRICAIWFWVDKALLAAKDIPDAVKGKGHPGEPGWRDLPNQVCDQVPPGL